MALQAALPRLRRICIDYTSWADDEHAADDDDWQTMALRLAIHCERRPAVGINVVPFESAAIRAQVALPAAEREPFMRAFLTSDEEWDEWLEEEEDGAGAARPKAEDGAATRRAASP
jgi:hypothetical protein